MDIRLFFPPRPGSPPSTVQVVGVPEDLTESTVEPLARKLLDAKLCVPYLGRVAWTDMERAARENGIDVPKAGKKKRGR